MKKIDLNDNAFFRGTFTPFQRMNPALLDFFREPERWKIRALCPSSVQIVFKTNAERLSLSWKYGAAAREVYSADVKAGDQHFVLTGEQEHLMQLPSGDKKVEISLPHLVILEEFNLLVNDAAQVEVLEDARPKLLVCGDSILQGMTCSRPALISVMLAAAELDMQVHNTSVGGAIMQPLPVKETLSAGGAGDVAIVGYGINDAAQHTPLELFRERTAKVLEYLNGFAGKSFMIVPIPTTIPDVEKFREEYSQIIRDEQKRFPRVTLIEGAEFYPGEEELFVDGVHPNDQGMEIYARGLIKALR